jgi:glycosyltransferase involved in cell wall biosynthesis
LKQPSKISEINTRRESENISMSSSGAGYKNGTPSVTIGMPVYNGENFIEEAVQSILEQTYTDFELVISDNASTDRTEAICREYAKKDSRVRYIRNKTNIGASENANQLFSLCSSKYFKLAAHDDKILPNYLETCVSVLENDSSVALCHSQTRYVDGAGSAIPYSAKYNAYVDDSSGFVWGFDPKDRRLDSLKSYERFDDFIRKTVVTLEVWGVIRNELLQKVRAFSPYFGSDRVTLADLILLGRFIEIKETLFLKRCHEDQVTIQSVEDRAAACGASNPETVRFSGARCLLDYLTVVNAATLPISEKMRCYMSLARLVFRKQTMRKLFVPGRYNYFGINFDFWGAR